MERDYNPVTLRALASYPRFVINPGALCLPSQLLRGPVSRDLNITLSWSRTSLEKVEILDMLLIISNATSMQLHNKTLHMTDDSYYLVCVERGKSNYSSGTSGCDVIPLPHGHQHI